jgi:hypothetical protein
VSPLVLRVNTSRQYFASILLPPCAGARTGIHARFRLGGACFPPILFYRIFTHRPVADIGAFAPRNYCAEATIPRPQHGARSSETRGTRSGAVAAVRPSASCGRPAAGERGCAAAAFDLPETVRRFVRPDGRVGYRPRRGWYRRTENNGWRAVDEVRMALSDGLSSGGGGGGAGSAGVPFHHSTSVRREERERRRKQRRREWLVAMYRCGARTGCSACPATCGALNADVRVSGDFRQLVPCRTRHLYSTLDASWQ